MEGAKQNRRNRVQRSCDQCWAAKRKCDLKGPCSRCKSLDAECTSNRAKQSKLALRLHQQSKIPSSDEAVNTNIPYLSGFHGEEHSVSSSSTSSASTILTSLDASPSASSVSSHPSTSSPKDALYQLFSQPTLLNPIVTLYFAEVDSLTDLLTNTRLDRLVKLFPDQPLLECCPDSLRSTMHLLLVVVTLLTAHLHPLQVEAILQKKKSAFVTAQDLEMVAYSAARDSLDGMAVKLSPSQWEEESFAASYILRVYEKLAGKMLACKEGLLIDTARLQQAGLHRFPRRSKQTLEEGGREKNSIVWKEDVDLLAYRVFWAYFDKDRTTSWITGAGYSLHSRHSNICLRDPFGHSTIDSLAEVDQSNSNDCQCSSIRTEELRTLSAFAGINARLGAIIGRFFDRMAFLSSPACQWPNDAEQLAFDFEKDLQEIRGYLSRCHPHSGGPLFMTAEQKDITLLIVAHVRSDNARYICDAFAEVLTSQGKDAEVIRWMLIRRRLDMAASLVDLAAELSCRATVYSASWRILIKFVDDQVRQLLSDLSPWLSLVKGSETKLQLSCVDEVARQYLLSRLRSALTGRNVIVLLTRHYPLTEGNKTVKMVSDLNAHFEKVLEHQNLLPDHWNNLKDPHVIVDEYALINSMEQQVQAASTNASSDYFKEQLDVLAHVAEQQESPQVSLSMFNEDLTNIFADLPSLEHLLWPLGFSV